jgi:hypothetical protein
MLPIPNPQTERISRLPSHASGDSAADGRGSAKLICSNPCHPRSSAAKYSLLIVLTLEVIGYADDDYSLFEEKGAFQH